MMTSPISNENLLLHVQVERERRRRARAQAGGAAPIPTFRGAADTAQTITDRAWLLAGPAETGKTWAGLYRLDTEARKWPNSQWLLTRKVRTTMDSTVLQTWRRIVALRGDVTVFGGEKPVFYTYPNGARVWVVGFDNPDKILSGEFDGAYNNQAEELDEADYEMLTTRITGRGAVTSTPMVWGDCNPGPENHWIMRRKQDHTLTVLESVHEDNPTLWDGTNWTAQGRETMKTLDRLTGVRYQRLRLGRWVGSEGQFYTQLDERIHLVDVPSRAGWPVWAALDYGFVHPLSFGVFTQDPYGNVYVLGHHARHKWYIQQHADALDGLLLSLGVEKSGLRIVAGHDCWNKGKDDPETIADKFAKRGYRLERATIARVIGAQAIGERLGNPDSDPPVRPLLFFTRRAKAVFDTLARMVGDPRDAEDVLKVNADAEGRGGDDDYDMLRYGCMAVGGQMIVHRLAPAPSRWKGI